MGRCDDALKTRDFATDEEVAALVRAFENATIPAPEFTHAAHIAVALSYLDSFSPDEALQRMREKIRFFAAHHGALLDRAHQIASSTRQMDSARPVTDSVLAKSRPCDSAVLV